MPPVISHRRDRLDLPRVIGWIMSSYWGHWMSEDQIRRSFHNSMCFAAYSRETGQQIGFARVVSDHSTTSMLTDVYVDEPYRRQGIGKALVLAVVEHSSVARTICVLQCRPENLGLYLGFGFVPVGGAMMVRNPT